MAVESTDFELSLASQAYVTDRIIAASEGSSSAIVNQTWAQVFALFLSVLTFADLPGVAAAVHEHTSEEISDWADQMALKLDVGASIPTTQVTGLDAALALLAASDHVHAYTTLTGLSTDMMAGLGAADYAAFRGLLSLGDLALISWGDTMADDAQTSDYFVAARSGSAGSPVTVTGAQLAAMVLAEATIDSIDGLTAALGGKLASDAEIPQSQVTNLTTDLAAKLGAADEIPQSQVTDLVSDLAAKLGATDPIPQSQVTDLAATLAALTIPIAQISDRGTGTGGGAAVLAAADAAAIRTLLGLGTMALADTASYLAAGVDVEVDDIAGLGDRFDTKLDVANPAFTGQMQVPAGSIGAPSLVFAASLDAGWFQPAAGEWGWSNGDATLLRLWTHGLRVGGQYNVATPVADYIGYPALQVIYASDAAEDISAPKMSIVSYANEGSPDLHAPTLHLQRGTGGVLADAGYPTSGTILGRVAYDGGQQGNSWLRGASAYAIATTDWSASGGTGEYVVETTTGTTTAERLRVSAAGAAVTGDMSATGAVSGASAALTGAVTAASATLTGTATAKRVTGPSYTLSDDTAMSITPTATATVLLITSVTSGISCLIAARTAATVYCALVSSNSSNVTANNTDGNLAGTTGTDGQFTIRCYSTDGKIYIENRRGAPVTFTVTELG